MGHTEILFIDPARKQEHRSHPFPQKARKWMGHPDSIHLPDQ
jgi:hypothetical protein